MKVCYPFRFFFGQNGYVNSEALNPFYNGSDFVLLLFLAGYMVTNTVLGRDQLLWEEFGHFDKQPTLYPIHKLGWDSYGGSPLLNSIGAGGVVEVEPVTEEFGPVMVGIIWD